MFRFLGWCAAAHNGVFYTVQRLTEGWLLGLAARLIFASVLLNYFWNAAFNKVIAPDWTKGGQKIAQGPFDYLTVEPGAYGTIAPAAFDAAGNDPAQMDALHHLVVYAGTYAEFLLPLMIVIGLFTRIASVGMILFIAMMSWVDVHREPALWNTAELFNNQADALIMDQRLMWLFPLIYLATRGAGGLSLDYLFARRRA